MSDVSFHSLRHTSTSLLKNAGVSDVVARDIIGHESEAISRSYTHIETETKRKAVDSMPDVTAKVMEAGK
jgi:integrase